MVLNDQNEIEKILDFEKRSWAIKLVSIERWGEKSPCPIRFTVNPYQGCEFKCPYCYTWYSDKKVSTRVGFRDALKHDIERAKKFGINSYLIEFSASTDPFQYIEKEKKESLYALKELLQGGFKILIVTKNPSFLLLKDYSEILNNKNVFIDVTITSLKEGTPAGRVLNNNGSSAKDKIRAVKKIIENGKDVRIRIDPVIPSFKTIRGQTPEDLKDLVEELSKIGVKTIITKTLRLNAWMPDPIKNILLKFYKENGCLVGSNYILSRELRRKMLEPIYSACQKFGLSFCPCYDLDAFSGKRKISFCDVQQETLKRMSEVYKDNARVVE